MDASSACERRGRSIGQFVRLSDAHWLRVRWMADGARRAGCVEKMRCGRRSGLPRGEDRDGTVLRGQDIAQSELASGDDPVRRIQRLGYRRRAILIRVFKRVGKLTSLYKFVMRNK